MKKRMNMRDFVRTMKNDIDVYNNVTDDDGICYCPPIEFTSEGEKYFGWTLDNVFLMYRNTQRCSVYIRNLSSATCIITLNSMTIHLWISLSRKQIEIINGTIGMEQYFRKICSNITNSSYIPMNKSKKLRKQFSIGHYRQERMTSVTKTNASSVN